MKQSAEDLSNLHHASPYVVSNPLLQACIGDVSSFHTYSNGSNSTLGFKSSKRTEGYLILCCLLQDALKVYRYYYMPDRAFSKLHLYSKGLDIKTKILELHRDLDPSVWDDAIIELRQLYEHVQSQLLNYAYPYQHITLKRKIIYQNISTGYARNLVEWYFAYQAVGAQSIPLNMDTLNSYLSLSTPDNIYPALITLKQDIAITDILYCHDLIAGCSDSHAYPFSITEVGEWVVINRSRTGLVHMPLANILLADTEQLERELGIDIAKIQASAEKIIAKHKPVIFQSFDL
ncbi:hypothetical protein [Stenoxybacter acetivorans]|uniref:hypothetical protein n=1 Tax=Stenoxybacter acetivorans TaxID=422441 RepID=UPI000690A741|nr:hypothetical protein [Stenoxybacter acetivorans]